MVKVKRMKTRQKQVLNQEKNRNESRRLELEGKMAYCTGTEHYYKSPVHCFLYTDGVKTFAQEAGAYWFLSELNVFIRDCKEFTSFKLVVKDSKAEILVNDKPRKKIPFTDCPEGEWLFFYEPNGNPEKVLMWCNEY